jgi:uncharacterized protein (DUF427 family)
VVDSRRVLLVREPGALPVFAFPREDVRAELLGPVAGARESAHLGPVQDLKLLRATTEHSGKAWTWTHPPKAYQELANHLALSWDAMDHWYEEAEEIFRHPRDPFHRVDAIESEWSVKVIVNGQVIAESRRPRLLFETGHPVRYYLPTQDVQMDLLAPSETTSRCPYKGVASYWRSTTESPPRDIAWAYLDPIPECPSIRGLISFFNERVDAIEVDGEVLQAPRTSWS